METNEDDVSQQCSGCDASSSRCWCVDCGESLCDDCVSAHRRVSLTRSHQILNQPPGKVSARPTKFCRLHPCEPLKLYCFTCSQFTCRDCQLMAHMDHRYLFVTKAVDGVKKRVESLIQPIRSQRDALRRSLQHLRTRLEDIAKGECQLEADLHHSFNLCSQILKGRRDFLSLEVKRVLKAESDLIEQRVEKLQQLQQDQTTVEEIIDQVFEMQDLPMLLRYFTKIKLHLKEVNDQDLTLPETMSQLNVLADTPDLNALLNFGRLQVGKVPFTVSQPANHSPPPTSTCLSLDQTTLPQIGATNDTLSVHQSSQLHCLSSNHHTSDSSSVAPPTSTCPMPSSVPPTPQTSAPGDTASPGCLSSLLQFSSTQLSLPTSGSHQVMGLNPAQPGSILVSLQPFTCNHTRSSFKVLEQNNAPDQNPPNSILTTNTPNVLQVSCWPISSPSDQPPLAMLINQSLTLPAETFPAETFPAETFPKETFPKETLSEETFPAEKVSAETLPKKTLAAETLAVETLAAETLAAETLAAETLPKKTLPAETLPKKTLPAETLPAETLPKKTLPAETLPKKTLPAETLPKKTLPAETLPVETIPKKTLPAETLPKKTLPAETLPTVTLPAETLTKKTLTKKTLPAETLPAVTLPAETLTKKTLPAETLPAETLPANALPGNALAEENAIPGKKLSVKVLHGWLHRWQMQTIGKSSVPKRRPRRSRKKLSRPGKSHSAPPNLQPLTDKNSDLLTEPLPPLKPEHEFIPSSSSVKHRQSLVVRAVADSACDHRGQRVVAGKLKPSKNKPTSTMSEESEAAESRTTSTRPTFNVPRESGPSGKGSPSTTQTDGDGAESSSVIRQQDFSLRRYQPWVSLIRLPLSQLRTEHPLPGVPLVPRDATDEIYIEDTNKESQSHVRDVTGNFPDFTEPVEPVLSPESPESPVLLQMVFCSACGSAHSSIICSACGRGFHRDCHVPPVGPEMWAEWNCSLCQDLSDPSDPYSSVRPASPKGPGLSLLDQRRCETLLLHLKVEGCIRLAENARVRSRLTLISERLSRRRRPTYHTTVDFVSDIWSLFRETSSSPQDDLVVKELQQSFHVRMMETLNPELRPTEETSGPQQQQRPDGDLRQTRKRLREFLDLWGPPGPKTAKTDQMGT